MKTKREKSKLPKKTYKHFTLNVSSESYKLKKNAHIHPVTFDVEGLKERIIPELKERDLGKIRLRNLRLPDR